jgi:hypothetical protein
MMGRIMIGLRWGFLKADQSNNWLSWPPVQELAIMIWATKTTRAAMKPTTERAVARPLPPSSSSSSSSTRVKVLIGAGGGREVSGWVGAERGTVAFGRPGPPVEPPGRIGAVEVVNLIVGAGAGTVPALRSGMVGAGAGGRGAPPAVGAGGAVGVGGRTEGALGGPPEGAAGGASAALSVTRTVSFFNGTLDVCLDGAGD